MAQQPADDSKVALDRADLPLPELEEEPVPAVAPTTVENDFDPEVLAPEEEQKRGLPKVVLLGGGALAVLVVLAAIWFFFLRSGGEEALPETETETVVSQPVDEPRTTLRPFIIPIMPDPRGRLLKVTVMLEFNTIEDMDMALEAKIPVIRDVIYRTFRNRSVDDINNARLNNVLPMQLKNQLNKALGVDIVKHIYFPEFLFAG